jgi:hypothetical protein
VDELPATVPAGNTEIFVVYEEAAAEATASEATEAAGETAPENK